MFGLGKKQPSRPEPVKPDDWDQRLPTELTRRDYELAIGWRDVAESEGYPSPESWSRAIGQQAIDQFWRDEGPVSQKEFMAQLNGWVYAWKASTYANLYVQVEAPDWGVPAILTLTSIGESILNSQDMLAGIMEDQPLQRRLLSAVDFDEFSVPAGPAGRASYKLNDFFNGENTTVFRETIMVFSPLTKGSTEISAATHDDTMVPFIKDQTRLIAETLRVTPLDQSHQEPTAHG